MSSKSVQILFTDREFTKLKAAAAEKSLTVPLYIKSIVLEDDVFSTSYQSLIDKVEQLSTGTKFTLKALFGTEWTMPTGIKLTLGKTYYSRVKDGTVTNVKALGKDSSNVMWYEKL